MRERVVVIRTIPVVAGFEALEVFFDQQRESTGLAIYVLIGGRAYCAWVCPVNIVTDTANWLRSWLRLKGGAFYSLLGKFSVARMSAVNREQCNDCTDCLKVCPEPHVLKLPVYGADKGASPIVLSPNCTNC